MPIENILFLALVLAAFGTIIGVDGYFSFTQKPRKEDD